MLAADLANAEERILELEKEVAWLRDRLLLAEKVIYVLVEQRNDNL